MYLEKVNKIHRNFEMKKRNKRVYPPPQIKDQEYRTETPETVPIQQYFNIIQG